MKRYDHLGRVYVAKIPTRRNVTNAFPVLLESMCVHNSRRHNTIFLPIVCNLSAMHDVTARIFTEYINLGSVCRTVLHEELHTV